MPLTTTLVNAGTTTQSLTDFLTQYGLTSNAPTAALTGTGSAKASLTISPATTDYTGWQALAGKALTFTVDAWINEAYFQANPELIFNDIVNKANYKITEENGFEVVPDEDQVTSVTAKYKFQKNDANTGQPLTGATFSVNKQGDATKLKFVLISSGVYMLSTDVSGVDTLAVGSDGTLTLLGLDQDVTYQLSEVTAPLGYVALAGPINFVPNRTDDYDNAADLTVNSNDSDTFHNIYNTPANILPSTGGRGFAIFSLVAVAGLGGAGVLYYLKRKNAQEVA